MSEEQGKEEEAVPSISEFSLGHMYPACFENTRDAMGKPYGSDLNSNELFARMHDEDFILKRAAAQKAAETAAAEIKKVTTREEYEKVAWAEYYRLQEYLLNNRRVVYDNMLSVSRQGCAAESAAEIDTSEKSKRDTLQAALKSEEARLAIYEYQLKKHEYDSINLDFQYLQYPPFNGRQFGNRVQVFYQEDIKKHETWPSHDGINMYAMRRLEMEKRGIFIKQLIAKEENAIAKIKRDIKQLP